jgi:hypothetical protein
VPAPTRPLLRLCIALALAAGTVVLYFPTLDHAFLSYDDDVYITLNPALRAGLSRESVTWALTATYGANWFPLTWVSYLIDQELHGLSPAGVHAGNVLLHAASAVLLFLALVRLTGATWRSALVAGFFAVHPVNVESVAWAAQRRTVLAGLFWMLGLWLHAGARDDAKRGARIAATALAMALGAMAKPMMVTFPFVLLLLDYWPLGRLSGSSGGLDLRRVARCAAEKLPLFAVAAGLSVVTFLAQSEAGVTVGLEILPASQRLANALVAYVGYLGHLAWPAGLSAYYPHPEGTLGMAQVAASVGILSVTSLAAVTWRARRPYLIVGWLWYLGTLVPMIGLVQVGSQAMADRYAYIPTLGILIAFSWALGDAISGRLWARRAGIAGALVALGMLALTSRAQLAHWRDSVHLFEHALELDADNPIAHHGLALELAAAGFRVEAAEHHRTALRLRPGFLEALNNLAWLLATTPPVGPRDRAEAVRLARAAVGLRPQDPNVLDTLAVALASTGDFAAAREVGTRALALAEADARFPREVREALAERVRLYHAGRPYQEQ